MPLTNWGSFEAPYKLGQLGGALQTGATLRRLINWGSFEAPYKLGQLHRSLSIVASPAVIKDTPPNPWSGNPGGCEAK